MAKLTAKDKRYREHLREYPCIACGIEDGTVCGHHLTWMGTGMGMKSPECYQVSVCFKCHDTLHRHGEKTFWAKLGKSLDEIKEYAEGLYRSYHA